MVVPLWCGVWCVQIGLFGSEAGGDIVAIPDNQCVRVCVGEWVFECIVVTYVRDGTEPCVGVWCKGAVGVWCGGAVGVWCER